MTAQHNDACIIMFAKLPRLGKVKTRLQPELSAEQALDVYQQLFYHSLNTLRTARLCPFELWFDATPAPAFAEQIMRRYGPDDIRVQQGDDLGQRMQHAARDVLRRADKLLLIGADCPAIDKTYLSAALRKLSAGVSAVLGPANDGGYVMLGGRTANLPIFNGIDWGSNRVLAQTRQRLSNAGIDWHELRELCDIDRPEDIVAAHRFGIVLG